MIKFFKYIKINNYLINLVNANNFIKSFKFLINIFIFLSKSLILVFIFITIIENSISKLSKTNIYYL